MFVIEKPLPAITEDGAPYWDGCRAGELRAQRCTACGHLRWPPSVLCPRCLADGGDWVRALGPRHDLLLHRRPPARSTPRSSRTRRTTSRSSSSRRASASTRTSSTVRTRTLRVGLPVEVVFDKVNDEVTLPRFRPRR